jgi:beta-lactamase superfamily II metal-dependent hydrolase
VVVHLGDGDWIVVDSCLDKKSGQPAALKYLENLGVKVVHQVKLVVATHWHDDHIQGLADVLRAAQAAKFASSAAYPLQDLARLVVLGNKTIPQSSATREFQSILQILAERRQVKQTPESVGPIPALANKKLLALDDEGRSFVSEVFALSPADGVFNRAEAELRYALSLIEARKRPSHQGANQLSVVLWLQVGRRNVLLGADLEHVPGVTEGWKAIAGSRERPAGRAEFFKVPHHGSNSSD